MSTYEKDLAQIRDLRTAPDQLEPTYSDEEEFVNNQPSFIQNEDEIHAKLVRSNHRSCSSCGGPQRSKNISLRNMRKSDSAATGIINELNHERVIHRSASANNVSMDTSANSLKEKRRQKGRDRAKERSDKIHSLTSGCDRGRIDDTTTTYQVDASSVGAVHNSLSSLCIEVESNRQQIVSVTPDRFESMQYWNTRDGTNENITDSPSRNATSSGSVQHGTIGGTLCDSDCYRNIESVSVCNMLLNRIDLNPNEQKQELLLNDMNLSYSAVPVNVICGTMLRGSLQKLSLSGNPLRGIHPDLVVRLPALQMLDISRCQLHQFPKKFDLPRLKILNLSNNELTEFPNEDILFGLPELCELIVYGNLLTEVLSVDFILGSLSKLVRLDVGFNNITDLPAELDQLKELRHLNISNNRLRVVPMRICEMDLHVLDVSQNPIIEPPAQICALGMNEMRQYWYDIRTDGQMRHNDSRRKTPKHGKSLLMRSITSRTAMSDLSESSRQTSMISLHSLSSMMSDDRTTDEILACTYSNTANCSMGISLT